MVSLAKRLEDRPFHLIASHCQNNPKSEVVAYIKKQGVAADAPNFTVTSQARHPDVQGNGHVPYYIVFDHRGKLVHHHMCGAYHGGDGLKMIEWVDQLLEDAPDLYLGEEPFEHVPDLAERIAFKKGFAKAVAEVEAGLEDESVDAGKKQELQRLADAVRAYYVAGEKRADRVAASKPNQLVALLKEQRKELKGTKLGAKLDEKIAEASKSKHLKAAIAVQKKLDKILRGLEKRKPCKTCKRAGHEGVNLDCPACRKDNASAIEKAVEKLEKLAEEADGLPIAQAVQDALAGVK